MSNVTIYSSLVNGDQMPYHDEGEACKYAVELVTGDDLSPPARNLTVVVKTKSGKTVKLVIPNGIDDYAIVQIDGELV